MIEFKGSQKAFFKAYPIDKRSFDEEYQLINANGKQIYKFIGTLGEKNFKKVETPKDVEKAEFVVEETKKTNGTNVSDVKEVDDLEFANLDDAVVEEKNEEVPEASEAKVEEKTETEAESIMEEKPKKKTITAKRKELLDAFDVLSGVIGIEIDADCPVDFFALMNVISEFERGDFSTEPSTYVDMFKYFLNKYPKHAKEIHVCIDYLEEVYNDIRQKKSNYDKQVYNFYSHCGLGAEKQKKEQHNRNKKEQLGRKRK